MSHSPETASRTPPTKQNQSHHHQHSRSQSLQEEALKQVLMKLQSVSPSSEPDLDHHHASPSPPLSDEVLLSILSRVSLCHYPQTSRVCKRWLYLHGQFVRSLRILDWGFLDSGRVVDRFPNLTDVDIVHACLRSPRSSGIVVTKKAISVSVDSLVSSSGGFFEEGDVMKSSVIDQGLRMIASWYPNLRRLAAIGASEAGLRSVGEDCPTLQELELHCCGDMALKGLSGLRYLQVVKLIGSVDGFYSSVVSDIGLTILAQGCSRLVKLELCGCEGSYDGVKAIGQCCLMLEELTLCDHRMDGGWLSGLSYCGNLKTLRLKSCRGIDSCPGPEEYLGSCPTIEELHLQQCQVGSAEAMRALFSVCEAVRDVVFHDCWGLTDSVFAIAAICRYGIFFYLFCVLLSLVFVTRDGVMRDR